MAGYDTTYEVLDEYVNSKFREQKEYFGKTAYRNWYPFKSPKGVWMAFHLPSYSDIRVVNLETKR